MNLRNIGQSMTDDAKCILSAFKEAPVMTLQAITTMTGLSAHATRFILEQMQLFDIVQVNHGRWSVPGGLSADAFGEKVVR